MRKMHPHALRVVAVVAFVYCCCTPFANAQARAAAAGDGQGGPLELKRGDHIAVVGNTLADRMQHHNWLETYVQAKFPEHQLVWRNLAVAGDEVVKRHRSQDFGTPDEWLGKVGADVVFAFFGFNESFGGEAGLGKFKEDLGKYLRETKAKQYGKGGNTRVVLFSPIALERHQDPNFSAHSPDNDNVKRYAGAMAEVAKAEGVRFVDLFAPSERLYAEAAGGGRSLTINGMHLSEEGDRLLAGVIFEALFGEKPAAPEGERLARLRGAIKDKNWQWHQRYRTVDGYNVYGGRSQLKFPSGEPGKEIRNFDVMQQEMSQRDVLTANRDPLVWAAAKGQDYKVDDSNLPPVTPVPTNKPDAAPPIDPDAAIANMKLHPGLKANLFASEKQFPDLVNPVQMAWDTKGRLWVAAWLNYPERTPTSKKGDSLLVLEDTDGDGKADKCTPFLDDLNCPTGFQFYKDGVLVMQAPDVWFVRDTNNDGKGDQIERVLMGMDSADSHHTTNSMCYEPGGAVYLSDGVFHRTQVETPTGPVRNEDAAIYRFEPKTGKVDRYAPYAFANPHGRVFDAWGRDLITDATGNNTYFGPAISGRIDYPAKHKTMQEFWKRPSRPSPGTHILTSRHFPEEFWGNFLNMNVISFQGVYRVKVKEEGSGLWGESLPDLISSTDPNFRPTALATGPDGALYMADWYNPIIGHMQHHLRDPNRDKVHGRVYRITYEGRPLLKAPKIDGQPIPALLELLKEPEDQTRELAKIELDRHDSKEVIAATKQWVASLKQDDPAYPHHLTEALWVHQWHNTVDVDLLNRVLASPEPRARAAATRVLTYWRDRVPNVLALLKERANDPDARVRLQAVRGASFFDTTEAVEVALEVVRKPTDYYLDYVISETLRQLEPHWRKALESGQPIAASNPDGMRYILRTSGTIDLLKLPRTAPVLEAILTRTGLLDADRLAASKELAAQRKVTEPAALLDLIEGVAKADPASAANAVRLLPMQSAEELKAVRQRLEGLTAADGAPAEFRRPAWAALAMADGSFDAAWEQAAKSPATLADLMYAVPMIYDTDLRAKAAPKLMPYLATGKDDNVRRAAIVAAVSITSEQKPVAAALADLIHKREGVGAAARGLRALPQARWGKAHGPAVARDLVAWAKTVPADRRTQPEYLDAVQLANELAGTLPTSEVDALRRELKELRVSVFLVTAVREQMRYDTTTLVVEAGKPFEILFENTDFMPHNLVVVQPGARREVGTAAMTMKPDQIDKQGRSFVPKSKAILGATRLLEAGQKESLKLTAPKEEGVYEYVCTYPGHWEVMWGKLVVTKDVDAYLRNAPKDAEPARKTAAADHAHHGGGK